jgi:UDP-N-acetylmuramoyl-tripeptide--D-alanyl-D-alanine ligase
VDRADPFTGYSTVLRIIIYGVVPAFGVWQFFRAKRALHVFQLEGYKRARFLAWCRANPARALFLSSRSDEKKPLVMTGRAWRILVTATALSVVLVLIPSGLAHIWWNGFPYDISTWAVMTILLTVGLPLVVVVADVVMAPIQSLINARFKKQAQSKLFSIAPTVIGVTGSFGKTSTKFAIASLIGPRHEVLATPGSFNTPLGLTRTINEHLTEEHRFLVAEMGAYKEGEIAELCNLVHPTIGVLTAIGPAHLDRFGSMDAIRRGKYEIVTSLPPDGTAIMNVDDPEVRALADRTERVKVIRYGIDPTGKPDITASGIEVGNDGTSFTVTDTRTGDSVAVSTRLLGRHSIGHVLAGVAAALATGRGLGDMPAPIAGLEPVEHRLQLIEGTGGVTVIDDAFNSNPEGASAALEVLDSMSARNKIVVTPGIIELGPLQAEENERFGERAAEVADVLIVVARVNRAAILAGAQRVSNGAKVFAVDTLNEATAKFPELVGPGDVVLFENDLPDQYEG